MGIAVYDCVNDLITMLHDDWNSDPNIEAGLEPKWDKYWEEKNVGLGDSQGDRVLIFPQTEEIKYFALYGAAHLHVVPIKIDVRTYSNEDRHNTVCKEIARIIKKNVRRDIQGHIDVLLTSSKSYTSDYRNMFREVISLFYRTQDPQ